MELEFQKVEDFVWQVKKDLQIAEITKALNDMNSFGEEYSLQKELPEIIALSARHHQNENSVRRGTESLENIQLERNKIIFSALDLLNEIKQSSISKVTYRLGNNFQNMTKRGEEAIDDMNRMSILMAESRLLELEAWKYYAGIFPGMDSGKVESQIHAFKEILNKIYDKNPNLKR